MLDIDQMLITVNLSVAKEEGLWIEYRKKAENIQYLAMYSLKMCSRPLMQQNDLARYVAKIDYKVMLDMCKKLGCRFFTVFHRENGEPPFDIYETLPFDDENATPISRFVGTVDSIDPLNNASWRRIWKELGFI